MCLSFSHSNIILENVNSLLCLRHKTLTLAYGHLTFNKIFYSYIKHATLLRSKCCLRLSNTMTTHFQSNVWQNINHDSFRIINQWIFKAIEYLISECWNDLWFDRLVKIYLKSFCIYRLVLNPTSDHFLIYCCLLISKLYLDGLYTIC